MIKADKVKVLKVKYLERKDIIPFLSNYRNGYSAKLIVRDDTLLLKGKRAPIMLNKIKAVNCHQLSKFDMHQWFKVSYISTAGHQKEIFITDARWFGLRSIFKGYEDLIELLTFCK